MTQYCRDSLQYDKFLAVCTDNLHYEKFVRVHKYSLVLHPDEG